jgi:CBS domain-containing protein
VAEFVGADRALKRLGLSTLRDVELVTADGRTNGDARVAIDTTIRDALSKLIDGGGSPLTVVDDQDRVAGRVTLELLGGLLANGGLSHDRETASR